MGLCLHPAALSHAAQPPALHAFVSWGGSQAPATFPCPFLRPIGQPVLLCRLHPANPDTIALHCSPMIMVVGPAPAR